jgi:hypothetical protein
MRPQLASLSPGLRYRRRLHYCGTCKAIGRIYGHRFRILLNHDTVFLAEVISALSGDAEALRDWNPALQSFNCLRVPKQTEPVPLCLEYAATATLMLGNFKLIDQIADTRNRCWRWLDRACSPEFGSAAARLSEWGFPLAELRATMDSQLKRERRGWDSTDSPSARMAYLAEPTGNATAMFLRHGVILVGRNELADRVTALGQSFGALVYLLDALADYESDGRNGTFNAIRASLDLSDPILRDESRRWAVECAQQIEVEIETALSAMPFSPELRVDFVNRLRFRTGQQTGAQMPILQPPTAGAAHSTMIRQLIVAVAFPWKAQARNRFLGGRSAGGS